MSLGEKRAWLFLAALVVVTIALMPEAYSGVQASRNPAWRRPKAEPGQLVVRGARRHRHRSVGRCLDPRTRQWLKGCR